jgi:DoxX-like family
MESVAVSKQALWTGRTLTILVALMLLLDCVGKFMKPPQVVDAFDKLGLPHSTIFSTGAILLVCTVIYLIPRTATIGAILLTGYLGGAISIHLRIGDGTFPLVFPAILGALAWAGIYFRSARLRSVIRSGV